MKNARQPSNAYLKTSSSLSITLSKPNLKLIVLDLNGTLVWRPDRAKSSYLPKPRTGLSQFLTFLFDNFAVMIWSSSSPKSVNTMVRCTSRSKFSELTVQCNAIFSDTQKEKLVAVWARDTLGLNSNDYNRKIQTYKNLDWLWDNRHLRKIKQFSQLDTIIIDDSYEKIKQHPNNVIVLPEYDQALHESGRDNALQLIEDYLDDLRLASNVSNYISARKLQFGAVAEASISSESLSLATSSSPTPEQDKPLTVSEISSENDCVSREGSPGKYSPNLSRNEKRAIRRSLVNARSKSEPQSDT